MITVQSSVAQRLFDHPVCLHSWARRTLTLPFGM